MVGGRLRPSRRPDVSAGMLLAGNLVTDLLDVSADLGRVITIAVGDAARAVYPYASEVLNELVNHPSGEWVDEDDLCCHQCDGEPNDVIVALRDQLDAAYARIDMLTVELARARRESGT